MAVRTIFSLLDEAVEKWGDAPALQQPAGKEKYQTYSWREYREAVREIAAGLHLLGIQKGDVIGLGSETRAEFYLADLGVICCGAASAALYVNSPPVEQTGLLARCGAKVVFVEDAKMLRVLQTAGGANLNVKWVLLTGESSEVENLAAIRTAGRKAMQTVTGLFERIHAAIDPEDHAILYLTSGATGEPKMVWNSHRALIGNVDMGPAILPNITLADRALAFLPSAHIAQRIGIELLPLRMGIAVYFSESLARMPHEFKTVQPTLFLAPPRVWERVYASVRTEVRKRNPVLRQIFYGAMGIGIEVSKYKQSGQPVPAWLHQAWKLADAVVFSKIRARFGGKVRFPVSGAAPLGRELGEFYEAIGMPLMEGYGLTEGGIVSLNDSDAVKLGTVGRPLKGVEVKLADDGELLVRSPALATGYFQDALATAEVFQNGWLHTGDVAEIRGDARIMITGRKKEMIVASNGKKVYPSKLEALFKTEPLISQMVVAGDNQSYMTALFTINAAAAEALPGLKGMSGDEIAAAEAVQTTVKQAVQRANKQLATYEQIRKFRVIGREFSIEAGEVTPTMKVRRAKVLANFKSQIAEMYDRKEDASS